MMNENPEEANRKYFDDLPDEMIIKIFSYLNLNDLALVSEVSSRWKELSQNNTIWKDIIFKPKLLPRITTTERIQLLQKIPALKAYSAMYTENISLIIDAICMYCTDFKHLHLSGGHDLTYPLLEKLLVTFPDIEKLDIPILKQEDPLQYAHLISQLDKLTYLKFSDRYAEVKQQVLKPIADGCPSLLYMNLGDNKFKDDDVRYFLQKKEKQLLSFEVWCPISLVTFKCLSECSNLEELNFNIYNYASDLTYNDMLLMRKLKKLKKLKLGYLNSELSKVVPSLFARQGLSNVVDLNLTIGINEKDLTDVILNCPQLTHFSICNVGGKLDDPFRKIKNCRNLKYLSLSGCSRVTRECIDLVAEGCPQLKYLSLSCSLETKDDVMLSVVKLKQLRCIDVSYSGFSGKHFDLFPKYLVHLKEIIAYESGMEDSIWNSLLKEIPHLQITGRYWEGLSGIYL